VLGLRSALYSFAGPSSVGLSVSQFDYELPPDLIAQEPAAVRDGARLLHLDRAVGACSHGHVTDLPGLLRPGDLLVVNDTKVFPARLLGRREPSGGRVECFLLGRLDERRWDALLHPGQKLKEGSRAVFGEGDQALHMEVLKRGSSGRRVVMLTAPHSADVDSVIDAIGHTPLPPYIKRTPDVADRGRYQTIFARARGSVAAPTAGLHFTQSLERALASRGVDRTEVTLHVGYGTFQPMRSDDVESHVVGTEHFEISARAADAINGALDQGRRIVAVGTTTTRALESAARIGDGRVPAGGAETTLYIRPGHSFRVVGGLVTNFHLPRSSLLVLVSAFAGREAVLDAYGEAVKRRYRFYSYGDAMLIT
jgi:S-adenosylmethionine:tRNA ribosyltransferase-isomerase